MAPGEGFLLLGVLDYGCTLTPTLSRKRERERTIDVAPTLLKIRSSSTKISPQT